MSVSSSGSTSAPSRTPYWLDDPARPPALPTLDGDCTTDLAVVGGGYLGLWTALLAKERSPSRDVVVIEGGRCGEAASGRNGGFCEASLTHGFGNGLSRWPSEMPELLAMGRDNLDGIEDTIRRHDIDCDFQRNGSLAIANAAHQVEPLRAEAQEMRDHGVDVTWLSEPELRARIDSPTFLGGYHDPDGATIEPARLAWGLRAACLAAGVRIVENTQATGVTRSGAGVAVRTSYGVVTARHVVLATNASPPLLRRLRLMTVPVYDYALMSEPLTATQRESIGWAGNEGWSDAGNHFVYVRTTRDGRILWGGYDAVYHYGSAVKPAYDQRASTFQVLADGFHRTFPQLADVGFTHGWGGVIDTCTRFTAFYGTAMDGRVGYALGFTGLGVAATRFAGDVVLDLLAGADTPRIRLEMVRSKPLPFPPEPFRWVGIEATTRSLSSADHNGGKENLWLRTMSRLGFGFDS